MPRQPTGAENPPSNPLYVSAPIVPGSVAFKREETRAVIAFALLGIFACEVVAALITPVLQNLAPHFAPANDIKDMLSVVFSPTVALVGSAVGFYFGSHEKK